MWDDIACVALKQGKLLELRYDGFVRSVEVHAVGRSRKGEIVIACWQVRGGSVSNEPVGWKLMKVAEVGSAVTTDEASQAPREGYRRGDRRMAEIFCEL